MIVVDSSVWIAHLRGFDTPEVRRLRAAADDDEDRVLVGDLILLEVLRGARDERHAAGIERGLRLYPVAAMLGEGRAAQVARNCRRLRARGITVRKTVDMIIGTFCIEGGHALLHDDRDFDPMAEHLGLLVAWRGGSCGRPGRRPRRVASPGMGASSRLPGRQVGPRRCPIPIQPTQLRTAGYAPLPKRIA